MHSVDFLNVNKTIEMRIKEETQAHRTMKLRIDDDNDNCNQSRKARFILVATDLFINIYLFFLPLYIKCRAIKSDMKYIYELPRINMELLFRRFFFKKSTFQ